MAGVRKKPRGNGKFQGYYSEFERVGVKVVPTRKVYFTGVHDRAETKRIAKRLEDDQRQIALGYRPALKSSDKARHRPFSEATAEYLAWGRAQGGVKGRPWATEHADKRESGLAWWKQQLGLETIGDLIGALPRVEVCLRDMQTAGRANLTIRHRADSLTSFIKWAVRRGLLDVNPLAGLVPFPKQARGARRAMTAEEVAKLLLHCAPERRLLYAVALASGLRANELRSLTTADLDRVRGGLYLRAAWTKNRKDGFQPLPAALVVRLAVLARGKEPSARLLTVGMHPARDLKTDFDRAGLRKGGALDKVDFHALRVAYTTFVIETGANIKEAQTLARHATPELTLNVYAKVRNERLHDVAEAVGRFLPAEGPGVDDHAPALALPVLAEVALKTGTDDAPVSGGKVPSECQGGKIVSINTARGNCSENMAGVHGRPKDDFNGLAQNLADTGKSSIEATNSCAQSQSGALPSYLQDLKSCEDSCQNLPISNYSTTAKSAAGVSEAAEAFSCWLQSLPAGDRELALTIIRRVHP